MEYRGFCLRCLLTTIIDKPIKSQRASQKLVLAGRASAHGQILTGALCDSPRCFCSCSELSNLAGHISQL
jgi:hypothetical protein